jgi:hypothetical protein
MSSDTIAPPFDAANAVFETSYATARSEAELEAPLIVLLAAELALHVRGERKSFPFSDQVFHTAKVGAHIAVALYTLAGQSEARELATDVRRRFESLRRHASDGLRALLAWQAVDQDLRTELASLLESSLKFAEHVLSTGAVSVSEKDTFAGANGDRILRITELATKRQMAALHAAVERALLELSPAERRSLQVIVLGDHQARSRSLGMQYFQRRLAEPEGADDRVTYAENVTDEKEAIALVGTRRLDCAIARAFFKDEKRLQRDVLADAAKTCLDRLQPAPIG